MAGSPDIKTGSLHGIQDVIRSLVLGEAETQEQGKQQIAHLLALGCTWLGMDQGLIARVEGTSYTLVHQYPTCEEGCAPPALPLKETYCAMTMASDGVVAFGNASANGHRNHPAYRRTHMEAYIGVPIRVGGTRYGTLSFLGGAPRDPGLDSDKEHVMLILSLAAGIIIERQQIAVALDRFHQLKNEFVSGISHELRTPLASIIGFAETIVAEPGLPEETRKEFLNIILGEGRRLAKMINDLLDLSQIESGRVALQKTHVDLAMVADQAMATIAHQARAKGITFTRRFVAEECGAWCDPDRMFQVALHLISNAVKFTPAPGNVEVAVSRENGTAILQVSDTGPGIPAKETQFLFSKFFKVAHPGAQPRGSGLGLAIVKQLIELHGGSVSVQSRERIGSQFTVRIPAEERGPSFQEKGRHHESR